MGAILTGIDGSASSAAALRWAAAVGRTCGAELRALGAWQYPPTTGSALPSPEDMDRASLANLQAFITAELGESAAVVRAEIGRGPAAFVLLNSVEQGDVDILVLGARGLGGFDGLLLGSVTQQCVEHAPCPVVVIRGDVASVAMPPAKVMVGLDGSVGSIGALDWAMDLVQNTTAEIVAVHAPGPRVSQAVLSRAAHVVRDEWCEPLRARDVTHSVRIEAGEARSALTRAAEEEGVDLIVVGARGLGPLRGLLLGSVAGYLVRYATRPIAVVPGRAH